MNSIHRLLHYYTPQAYLLSSLPEVTFIFKTLTMGQLYTLSSLYSSGKTHQYTYRTCELALIKIETASGGILTLDDLSVEILDDVAKEVLRVSTLSPEVIDKITTNLDIYFSDTLSSDGWKCDICKSKRLQGTRNCGFIGEKEKNKDFKIVVAGNLFTHCPIFELDNNLLNSAIEAYNIHKAGFLPEAGGWFDQTQTFCSVSILVNNKIEERNKAQMDKQIRESKQHR